jgi:lipoprotein-anchoring transpeptidase ErfK/SrfK
MMNFLLLRPVFAGLVVLLALFSTPAFADLRIVIDKSEQLMRVYDGDDRIYSWAVSTGQRLSWTPNGTFHVQWLHADHYSSRYNGAPMPWSIFFNGNIAIHGTGATRQLGSRASHGCVRLSVDHAQTLYRLVQQVGTRNVTIVVKS